MPHGMAKKKKRKRERKKKILKRNPLRIHMVLRIKGWVPLCHVKDTWTGWPFMNLELGPQQTPNLLVILDFLSSRIARNKCLLFISEKLMLINLNTKYSPWDLESAQQMRQACKLEGCSLGSAQSSSVISNSLWPHGMQHASPRPSPTPGACSNSYPSSRWRHPTISSSVVPFSSCLQSFPESWSFLLALSKYSFCSKSLQCDLFGGLAQEVA